MKNAGHCKIWTLSEDQNEYERMERLLSGENRHHVSVSQINAALRAESLSSLHNQLSVTVVHDPCDIRKPHSRELEELDMVRDLNGKIIPGYKTFNSIAIDQDRKRLHLLGCLPKVVSASSDEESPSFRRQQFEQIRTCSQALKQANPQAVLTHVLDREYDDKACFELIDKELGDKFVIRLKLNRVSSEQAWDEKQNKEVPLKLKHKKLKHTFKQYYQGFSWGGRTYRNITAEFSYDTVHVAGQFYGLVKVDLRTPKGRRIFKEPMLLLTNFTLTNEQVALLVFRTYLRRAKIEGVFKFLKQYLGWESFQVRDFLAIQHIIVLCFFIGGYFYEIESELVQNEWMTQVCKFGGGKGKVSKGFFLRGIAKIANYLQIKQLMQENNLSEEQIINMLL